MNIKWKKNKNLSPQIVLEKLNDIKFFNNDNKLSYPSIDYNHAFAALCSMINFPPNSTKINKEYVIKNAINNIARQTSLNCKNVITEINDVAKKSLAVREKKYHLLTSISFEKPYR